MTFVLAMFFLSSRGSRAMLSVESIVRMRPCFNGPHEEFCGGASACGGAYAPPILLGMHRGPGRNGRRCREATLIIVTERLTLRAGKPKDVDAFVRYLNDWDVQQWLTLPPFPYSRDDGEAYLEIVRARHAAAHPTTFVIADRMTDTTLGAAS